MPDPYASIEDIRARGVTPEAADDAAVLRALDRATNMIEAFTGRDFRRREETYLVDGDGTESLFLEDRPVIDVLELLVEGLSVERSCFALYGQAGYLRLDNAVRNIFAGFPGVFPAGPQNVSARGLFGYDATPPEVREAAILLAIEFLRTGPAEADIAAGTAESTRNAIGISRVKIDEISVDFQYPSDLKSGSGGSLTTGLLKADGLLTRFRRALLHAAVI